LSIGQAARGKLDLGGISMTVVPLEVLVGAVVPEGAEEVGTQFVPL
jgi:hypothetical protein